MTGAGVEIDTTDLVRGMRQLGNGLERQSKTVGMEQARRTASDVKANTPVRTGRLRATITVVAVSDGGAVTYGGGLPYADYIEGRTHAGEDAVDGADTTFHAAMEHAAEREVSRL
jgi:hypothetical protein